MSAPEEVLADSPADFDSSFAYALHGDVRRLLIVTIVGSILFPFGFALFLDPGRGLVIAYRLLGVILGLIGAAFFFGGAVALLFKVVTDAMIVSRTIEPGR